MIRSAIRAIPGMVLLAASLAAQGPLAVITSSLPSGTTGQLYSQQLVGSGGVRPYTWSATGQIPPGLTVSSAGTISGVPTTSGTFNLIVLLSDSLLSSTSQSLSITIAQGSGSGIPSITTTALPAATVGQSFTQTLQATGGTPPYNWTAGQGFPAFLTLNASSGTISGTPQTGGTFTFTVTVTDAARASAVATLTLKVTTAALTIITPSPIFGGVAGVSYAQSFRAAGGALPYRWSIASGNTDGLTLNQSTGDLQGVPELAGSFTFLLQVTDSSGASASQTYTLVVSPSTLTVTTTAALPAGAVGVSYSQRLPLSVSGGRPPYTWTLASGQAPAPGLTFSPSDQTIAGTPSSAGTYSFTVQVADAAAVSATRTLSLVINPAGLSITTARQFPDGALNQPYDVWVEASGGQSPYRWSATGLPSGLTINSATGQITGTPSAAGPFAVAITVVDKSLTAVSDRFTLNVSLPPVPGVTLAGPPSAVQAAGQFPIDIAIAAPYPAPITGEAILTFSAENGPVDRTIQFASGGSTAQFSIPVGSTKATSTIPLAVQTGTVAGTIKITLRLLAGGIDITPTPAPAVTTRMDRAAPVISNVQVGRNSGGLSIAVSGYSTAREITQVTFTFKAAAGQSLQPSAASISVPVENLFGSWFQDAANSQYGSQFVYTQPFTVEGDSSAVLPDTVVLTNRLGSVTFQVSK